jgi:hypothetical protein
MKKLALLFSLAITVALPGTSALAEIGYMRDVNTGCGEIAVDCSTCHNLNDFREYTENQGEYKSYGGKDFCVDGTWSPVRLSNDDLLDKAQTTTNLYFEELFGQFMSHMADAIAEVNADPNDDKVNPFVEVFPHCPELAAEIASDFSRDTGSLVRRVSNRTRNARNTPDDWQAKRLEQFEMMAQQGKDRTPFKINRPCPVDEDPCPVDPGYLGTMEFEATAFTNEEGIEYFNYMRSISLPPMPVAFGGPATLPNGKPNPNLPCLKCHGSTVISTVGAVTPDVTQVLVDAIEGLYPYDMALGYKAGNIRGAWTVKIPVVKGKN